MKVDLVSVPSQLEQHHLKGRAVVIFDVLRATTSIVTAIASGAREVRIFDSTDSAAAAGKEFAGAKLLCGERKCLPPPGFDLGNSPGDFAGSNVPGKTIFMSTTNGTRAIVAASGASRRFIAALVNASAMARCLSQLQKDVTLLCSGTDGEVAPEDLIGAGAVLVRLLELTEIEEGDETRKAHDLFQQSRKDLRSALRSTRGGQNVLGAGLDGDIDFAARLDVFDVVVEASGDPPVARRIMGACQPEPI